MEKQLKVYGKYQWAKLMDVSPEYISQLIKANRLRLTYMPEIGKDGVIDCPENRAIFKKNKKKVRKSLELKKV